MIITCVELRARNVKDACPRRIREIRLEVIGLKLHVRWMRPFRNCSCKNSFAQHVRVCNYIRARVSVSATWRLQKKNVVLYTCYAPPASLLASPSLFVSFRSRFSGARDQRANMISLSFSLSAAPCSETRVRYETSRSV